MELFSRPVYPVEYLTHSQVDCDVRHLLIKNMDEARSGVDITNTAIILSFRSPDCGLRQEDNERMTRSDYKIYMWL